MRFRDLVIRNNASPYGMTAAALLLFLVAFVFPPALYSSYIQEPDLMFLDPASLVFFLMCTLGFLLGLILVDFIFPVHGFRYERWKTRVSPVWFILLLLRRLIDGKLRPLSVLKFGAFFAAAIGALFVSFSMLRGSAGPDALVGDILGYTIAAYNRLAAVLDGRLRYPFSGKGLYLSGFVAFNNTFNKIFHVNQLFSWPDFDTVWRSEFSAVSSAGLNARLIWSGTFGYAFSDLKWAS